MDCERFLVTVVATASLAAACGSGAEVGSGGGVDAVTFVEGTVVPAATPADRWGVYDPVRGGDAVPRGFRPVLARDDIEPVYDPRFVSAAEAGWDAESLVIGVDLGGVAKAYPVAFLGRREMVIDSHQGIPTLVTW